MLVVSRRLPEFFVSVLAIAARMIALNATRPPKRPCDPIAHGCRSRGLLYETAETGKSGLSGRITLTAATLFRAAAFSIVSIDLSDRAAAATAGTPPPINRCRGELHSWRGGLSAKFGHGRRFKVVRETLIIGCRAM